MNMAANYNAGYNPENISALTNHCVVTSYWTLGGPNVFKTGEAHFSCKIWRKQVRFETDAVIIPANIILSGKGKKGNICYISANQPGFLNDRFIFRQSSSNTNVNHVISGSYS